ncbi:16S rRNA (guanine(527)-N(7))-methyltransferase RsmG [Sporichthya sp.]|uniref:16S rRNA (guanine(527)-N(7))-methyltransferase RsmG n=1 Tax=Sporichthya sp. TaxID=65475 RepID=UPI0018184B56|nr:16S rRNA (guanine(527)-N(7))-methyltransferase RsmG [Sporichthya sp.]MBA3741685.1 16S rRNA (guanine(527)-N(7))-methyltransferase RsmG [Sporichthya sp.]
MSAAPPGQLAPPPPESARELFGERLSMAVAYADLLAGDGVVRGLIGPREVPRLWDRHLLNCGVIAAELAPGDRVADVGSGAGLPGLVVAILRPDVSVTLIEPMLRRTTFLAEAVEALGLTSVTVRRDRAEDVRDLAGTFDVVLARAVAPLEKLAGWTVPLLRPGGRLLAVKGSSASEELSSAGPALAALGISDAAVRTLGPTDEPTTVIEARGVALARFT